VWLLLRSLPFMSPEWIKTQLVIIVKESTRQFTDNKGSSQTNPIVSPSPTLLWYLPLHTSRASSRKGPFAYGCYHQYLIIYSPLMGKRHSRSNNTRHRLIPRRSTRQQFFIVVAVYLMIRMICIELFWRPEYFQRKPWMKIFIQSIFPYNIYR
jgi:hypothetical protein